MAKAPNKHVPSQAVLNEFIDRVWRMGELHARNDLPWRFIDDAYAVYVSEVMLQQTQVSRVLNYWHKWMTYFPTVDALASASNSDVLERWQGLGYNRRALNMKRTAEVVSNDYGGVMPRTHQELMLLPGIGPTTAAGIMAFAYQETALYLETNVRTVFIHELFSHEEGAISDSVLKPLVESTCSADDPRGWYYALLDYGHYLKQVYPNPSRKSSTYARQSAFEGSHRQKRSVLLRTVLEAGSMSEKMAKAAVDEFEVSEGRDALSPDDFAKLVDELVSEGFFTADENMLTVL